MQKGVPLMWVRSRRVKAASQSARAVNYLAAIMISAVALTGSSVLRADEPSGIQAAIAIEQAMVTAIAKAEQSVVSIARVAIDEGTQRLGRDVEPFIIRPGMPREVSEAKTDPRDPDFVPKEFATGVVIDAKGLILTNYHCVKKEDRHLITTIGRKVFRCTSIYAADPRSDLAILKVDDNQAIAADDFVPIKFGDAKLLRKGQIVVALGNPYGIARDGQVSASWGIISNMARKLSPGPKDEEPTLHQFGTLIQTDARLNWGASGGALVNLKGEMVGLTTSLTATTGFEQAAGYAIPIDEGFKRIINTLRQGKPVEYGFLGVRPAVALRPEFDGGRHGLVVGEVTRGGPASRGGLSSSDTITHIGGDPVYDFDDLRLLMGRYGAGALTTLTFERNNRTHVIEVSLSKYRKFPGLKSREAIAPTIEPAWRGIRVDYATAIIELRQGNDNLPVRVALAEVADNSPAYRAGLRPGMFIGKVNNTPIDSPDDFRRAVAKLSGKVMISVVGEYNSEKPIAVEAE